ncbi:MAG: helix-turn-helix domain-containing protein [Paracoccaceae bacterium]
MKRLKLDQNQLASKLGVTRQVVNYAVNDRKPISRGLAEALGRLMGLPEDYWLRVGFLDLPSEEQVSARSSAQTARDKGGTLVDFQLEEAISLGQIDITPFDVALVKQASVDFTVGSGGLDLDGKPVQLEAENPYILRPGQTINFETEQSIYLQNKYIGRVGATTSLSRQGILTLHGLHVDPGYEGKLQFCLSNLGQSDYTVCFGDTCLSVEIVELSSPPLGEFSDPNGDRGATQDLLAQRSVETVLFEILEPHLSKAVSVTSLAGGRFQAGIEDLATQKTTHPTSQSARDAFIDHLRSMYVVAIMGHKAPPLDKFRCSLLDFMKKISLSASEAVGVLDYFGAIADDDCPSLFDVPGLQDQAWVELPTSDGQVSLFDLLEPIGAVELLYV